MIPKRPKTTGTHRRSLRRLLPALLVAGAGVLVYANAVQSDFVFDDRILLVENRELSRSPAIWEWFNHDYYWGTRLSSSNLYRPLTMLSYAALFPLTGLSAWTFHLANVLLHAAVSLAVWALGRRLLGPPAALAGALLFAVHPLHTEAVTSIVGRAELLAALGALIAALAFLQAAALQTPRFPAWALTTAAAFALALLSKEHVATLPAWCGLAWLLDRKRLSGRRAALLLGLLALVLLGFLLLRGIVITRAGGTYASYVQLDNPAFGVSAPRRWLTATAVALRYFLLFLWPQALSADYSYAQILASQSLGVAEAAGLLLIGVCLWAVFYASRRAPGLAVALAFAPAMFFVVSNFPFAIGTIMAERLTYLPSVGLCLLAGWALARLDGPGGWLARLSESTLAEDQPHPASARGGRPPARSALPGVAIVLLACVTLVLGIRTLIRNEDWRDQYTLFQATYQTSPRSFKVLTTLAQEEARRGNRDRAQALFEEARATVWNGLLYDPDFALTALAFGKRTLELGRPVQAAALFDVVLKKSPNDQEALVGMARAALMQGKREEAKVYAGRARSLGAKLPPELSLDLDR